MGIEHGWVDVKHYYTAVEGPPHEGVRDGEIAGFFCLNQ
jgi:hypothetical protein